MIAAKVNLTCRDGHRYFTPDVFVREWVGKSCLAGGKMRADGTTSPGRCLEPLRRIASAREARR